MTTTLEDSLNRALTLLGKGRESCAAIRKVAPIVERIRQVGVFDARRKGPTDQTAPALKGRFEELARRIRRHRSTCKMCHSHLARQGTKMRREIPILLPGES